MLEGILLVAGWFRRGEMWVFHRETIRFGLSLIWPHWAHSKRVQNDIEYVDESACIAGGRRLERERVAKTKNQANVLETND